MEKRRLILLSFVFFFITACGVEEIKFDKNKWNEKDDIIYKYRENMVNDLMVNHLKKGMPYKQIIDLLGEPVVYSEMDTNIVSYEIIEKYGWDIDPIEMKYLLIELTKDSLIKDFKIEHWKR
ncbi:MAG: Outer membrane protein assembly factor BamE [Bacteroidetes bacterium ADurb.Bin217]|nr:MAG: Outer membrane protein assembly factor BamE [Bacteroidetes bacterium ADurb.Bin217]